MRGHAARRTRRSSCRSSSRRTTRPPSSPSSSTRCSRSLGRGVGDRRRRQPLDRRDARIVQAYARRDPRVRLVPAPERGGPQLRPQHRRRRQPRPVVRAVRRRRSRGARLAGGDGRRPAHHPVVTGPLELDRLNPPWLAASRGRGDERGLPTFQGLFPTVHGNNMGMRRGSSRRRAVRPRRPRHRGRRRRAVGPARPRGVQIQFAPAPSSITATATIPAPSGVRAGPTDGPARSSSAGCGSRDCHAEPVAGWRSWLWLVAHLGDLRSHEGRAPGSGSRATASASSRGPCATGRCTSESHDPEPTRGIRTRPSNECRFGGR